MKLKFVVTAAIASIVLAGCAGQTKYEGPGYAYGCPAGAEKINSKSDLIKAKVEMAGSIPHIDVVDLRCAQRAGQLRIDVDLKNAGNDVHRIAYKFRWMDKDGMARLGRRNLETRADLWQHDPDPDDAAAFAGCDGFPHRRHGPG